MRPPPIRGQYCPADKTTLCHRDKVGFGVVIGDPFCIFVSVVAFFDIPCGIGLFHAIVTGSPSVFSVTSARVEILDTLFRAMMLTSGINTHAGFGHSAVRYVNLIFATAASCMPYIRAAVNPSSTAILRKVSPSRRATKTRYSRSSIISSLRARSMIISISCTKEA